jgi:hypothetical protein
MERNPQEIVELFTLYESKDSETNPGSFGDHQLRLIIEDLKERLSK